MRKTINIALSIAILTLSVFTFGSLSSAMAETKYKTLEEKFAYIYGKNIAERVLKDVDEIKIDKNILLRGFTEAIEGKKSIFDSSQEMDITKKFTDKITEKLAAEQRLKAKENKSKGMAFLKENKTKKGVMVTKSGLQYKVIKASNGAKPKANDKVRVHYEGKMIDGKIFDSSIQRKKPIDFVLNQVIKGWAEGVQLMSVGSKYRFYIPSELAYGERGSHAIPPNSVLIFDVELLKIIKGEEK